jgi:hypothetical protein
MRFAALHAIDLLVNMAQKPWMSALLSLCQPNSAG